MIKRALCVIMCCVIAAALSLSVFASPINIYESSYSIDSISLRTGSNFSTFSFTPFSLDFGTNYLFDIDFIDYDSAYNFSNPTLNGEFTISLQFPSTVFIACSTNYTILEPVGWDHYRDSSRDFTVTYTNNNMINNLIQFDFYEYEYGSGDPIELDSYSTAYSGTVYYSCFDDIPAGTYTLTYGLTSLSSFVDMRDIVCGIYVTGFSINDPVGSFHDGLIDFTTAINAINSNLEQILNSPDSTTDEKILAVNIADYDLNRIINISDIKYNGVIDNFISESNSIITNYKNGLLDINTAISDIQMTYFDALSQAITPEQGLYINTTNQIKLSELQLNWQINYKEELDSVITDEDLEVNSEKLSHLDELHNQEMEVLSNFELAEFESKLEFSLWTDTLPSDYTNYKSIFEYFLEDNKAYQISQFLIVPFSLVLVSVLLATTTVVLRRNRNG